MNATNMVQGNLALKLETPAEPTFTVVQGGRSGFQPLTVKPAQSIDKTVPSWAYANPLPALASLGRHALPFYLLHQPIILGILELVYSVR